MKRTKSRDKYSSNFLPVNPKNWRIDGLELQMGENYQPISITSWKAKNSRRPAFPLFHTGKG